MDPAWLMLFIPLGAILGLFLGKILFKSKSKKFEKKILEDAQKVLTGEKENVFNLDGKRIDVNTFIVKDDNDKEIKLIFGSGKIKVEEIKKGKKDKVKDIINIEQEKKLAKKQNKSDKKQNKPKVK